MVRLDSRESRINSVNCDHLADLSLMTDTSIKNYRKPTAYAHSLCNCCVYKVNFGLSAI